MRNLILAWGILVAVSAVAHATDKIAFKLDKIGDACGNTATNNADYSNCLAASVAKITAKMKGDVLCSSETCIVRLKCSSGGDSCTGAGFSVRYGSDDTGHPIEIRMASGKVAHYYRCGTCSAVEAQDDNQIPLRLMESARSLVLEVPASER